MSKFSGVCDLADRVFMTKVHDKGNYYVSDALECFEAFKKQCGGTIHQHINIKDVNENNQDFIKKHCQFFDVIKHEADLPNKASKTGLKHKIWYTYRYFDKEYSAKELKQKGGVYILKDIPFNTLLDIIPYFPYVISFSSGNVIVISNESSVDREEREAFERGYEPKMSSIYRKELANFYKEVCERYFNVNLLARTRIEDIELYEEFRDDGKHYYMNTKSPVDYMHDLKYVWADGGSRTHWTSPKLDLEDDAKVEISREDAEFYLKNLIAENLVKIQYVEKMDFPLYLE